ncbi:uncharacterized protein K444DRAFT_618617 [Hyaloscypha bicolor E]|uniref:Fungal N-terminal domain-containing protein n=1 Tax=Hyaloscypha bicolor E TaxID=1095630 RepID=A0A2J6STQ8_9HELO|nr:uncharacterized protein K444DRAFT_618617 [Hyaloscypha bicolor E]PMD54164.1 hypothetical protein K444DRAFT_618617 [Hyaloscypha bicolor E]
MAQDSPLSIAASVIGILTFAVAILLGIYARVIQLSQGVHRLIKLDDEIKEIVFASARSLGETGDSQDDALDASRWGPDFVREDFLLPMYLLDLKTFAHTCWILKQSTLLKMSEWDDRRVGIIKDRAEVEEFRSRRRMMQMSKLCRKIDDLERIITKGFEETRIKLEDITRSVTSSVSVLQNVPNTAANNSNDDGDNLSNDILLAERGIQTSFKRAMQQLDSESHEKLREVFQREIPTDINQFLIVLNTVFLEINHRGSQYWRDRELRTLSIVPTWLSALFSGRGPMMACLGCCVGCWTARRRRRRGAAPMYGTGWMAGSIKSEQQIPV